jgi:hypothetical protein
MGRVKNETSYGFKKERYYKERRYEEDYVIIVYISQLD